MAIDEKNVTGPSAGAASDDAALVDESARSTPASTPAPQSGLDDLRLRLDSPLFARDPGLGAAPQVPRLRELTWENVINATPQAEPDGAGDTAEGATPPAGSIVPALTPLPPRPQLNIESVGFDTAAPAPSPSVSGTAAPPGADPAAEADEPEPPRMRAPVPQPPTFTRQPADRPAVETASIAETWVDALGNEHALYTIEEPPPLAREPDPVVDGLAALILRHDPVVEPKVVEPKVVEQRVVEQRVVEQRVVEQRVVEQRVEPEPVATPAPVIEPDPEPVVVAETPSTVAAPTISRDVPVVPIERPTFATDSGRTTVVPSIESPEVAAELNRLAFLPDQDDDRGPVEVPAISVGEQASTTLAEDSGQKAMPTLSRHEMYLPSHNHAPTHVQSSYKDVLVQSMPVSPRRKRHLLRRVLSTVLLLSVLGGGLFAVKYYLLNPVHWTADLAPLVKDVETARGLSFESSVKVTPLPADEYAARLADASLGITDQNATTVAAEWRALGLLSGTLDRQAIGLAALPDSPAFYDPASGGIFVVDGLQSDLKTFAMHRALTLALLDQKYGWSDRAAKESPAVQRGTRAYYDGDALATAESLVTDAQRPLIVAQVFGAYAAYSIPLSPSPYASAVAGRLGLALYPYFQLRTGQQRDAVERNVTMTDAKALDLRRLVGPASTDTIAAQAQGMLFWYHVLAGRVDDDLAWRAAMAWRSDTTTLGPGTSGSCVTSILQVTSTMAPTVQQAFEAWAAKAPAASVTTVAVAPAGSDLSQVTIHACDPGATTPTNDGQPSLSLGGAPLLAEQYRQLRVAQPQLTPAKLVCAIYTDQPLTISDERGIVDTPDGWAAPGAHPTPDPSKC